MNNLTVDQFVENFVHKWELISRVKYYSYILDRLDYLHAFLTIDEYKANRTNVHRAIEQHYELFLNKSEWGEIDFEMQSIDMSMMTYIALETRIFLVVIRRCLFRRCH